jgi:hypothetical protein
MYSACNITFRRIHVQLPILHWKNDKCYMFTINSGNVFVALGIQHAMRHVVICDLSGCTMFFHIISQMARFSKKKKITEHKICVLIFSIKLAWNIYRSEKNWEGHDQNAQRSSRRVPVILWYLMKLDFVIIIIIIIIIIISIIIIIINCNWVVTRWQWLLHAYKIWNRLLLNLSRKGYMRSM